MVVLYAVLLPREIRLSPGGLELPPDRLALLVVLPWVLRQALRGGWRLVLADRLVLAAGLWMVLAMAHHYGLRSGLERGGAGAFDLLGAYAVARVCLRHPADLRRALLLFLPGVLLTALVIAIEAVSHRLIIHALAEALFGPAPVYQGGLIEGYRSAERHVRFGLLRAPGPFAHSIHAGLFLASLAALHGLAGFRRYPRWLAQVAPPLALFSLSAAAVIGLALGYGLLLLDWVQRRVRELSWPLLIACGTVAVVLVELASAGGVVGLVARYLTFDPQTAFYRRTTWLHGMLSVQAHPLFGIGYADYVRPGWMVSPSVDAHWLVLAMRFGVLPAVLLLAALVLALASLAGAMRDTAEVDGALCRGLAMALSVLGLLMSTVHLWGGLNAWFMLLLGAAVSFAQRPAA